MADVAGKARKDRSVTTDEVVFIHCCYEKGNLLPKTVEGKGVKVTDITKEDDFTNVSTVKYVIKQIKKSRRHFLLLFAVHWRLDMAAIELRSSQTKRLE